MSLSGSATLLGELGIWDGGGVLTTHQEFGGRVTQMDSSSGTSGHATHVAGTMVAAGVDGAAKGMSFQGRLAAYDWNYDESEMASAAVSGMNVSNHSYGIATGWHHSSENWYWWGNITISTTEDYYFGFYSSAAQEWDQIAYNAPYYTIVIAAGNDRSQSGPGPDGGHYVWDPYSGSWVWSTDTRDPDGGTDGYDCLSHRGNSKNTITVGAVSDIPDGYTEPRGVVMSSFSSWGPTDDGRIKPDLVTNGIYLYSCASSSNSSYSDYIGTSASTPNLSGSLNLLVRYYEASHADTTPRSSTMKALLIHTADEAGPNTGPDYMFGWGLMNTLKAAKLIQQNSAEQGLIAEDSLSNEQFNNYYFYSYGSEPIRITLAWTDPPGTPPPPSLNPTTLMLVNDLDLRLEHIATSTIYLPYVLNPGNPGGAASTGDNIRDNVEQIYVASPPAGQYVLTVNHKGTLASVQHYSIISSDELKSSPNTPPSLFSLLLPEDSAFVTAALAFDWANATDPDAGDTVRYSLHISPSLNFHPDSTIIHGNLPVSNHSDTLNTGSYFWKVKGYDMRGGETWSTQTWSFHVFLRGDVNGDEKITVSDVVYTINYLFKGGPEPNSIEAGDANCDGDVTVADIVYLINYLFKGGPPPTC